MKKIRTMTQSAFDKLCKRLKLTKQEKDFLGNKLNYDLYRYEQQWEDNTRCVISLDNEFGNWYLVKSKFDYNKMIPTKNGGFRPSTRQYVQEIIIK